MREPHPNAAEVLMYTGVKHCPNEGVNDKCYFVHTCVEYTIDEEGYYVPVEEN